MFLVTEDVQIHAGNELYLLESGDHLHILSNALICDFANLLKMGGARDVTCNDNIIAIECVDRDIGVFVDGLGMTLTKDVEVLLGDRQFRFEVGDQILVEQVPPVKGTGRLPYKQIGNFAKRYAKWTDEDVQARITEIQQADDSRAAMRTWVLEIQKDMESGGKLRGGKAGKPSKKSWAGKPKKSRAGKFEKSEPKKPEPKKPEPKKPEPKKPEPKKPESEKPDEPSEYEVTCDYDEIDNPLTTHAYAPFMMRTRVAAQKLREMIARALRANKIEPPAMETIHAEFGAVVGRPEFAYVLAYTNTPDETQRLMSMGAAAAMVAQKGRR